MATATLYHNYGVCLLEEDESGQPEVRQMLLFWLRLIFGFLGRLWPAPGLIYTHLPQSAGFLMHGCRF
jgi:hypothetical protein